MKKRTTVVAVIEVVFGAYLVVIGALFGSTEEAIGLAPIYVYAGVVFISAGVGLFKKSKFAWYFLTFLLVIGTLGTLTLLLLASDANILGQDLFGFLHIRGAFRFFGSQEGFYGRIQCFVRKRS